MLHQSFLLQNYENDEHDAFSDAPCALCQARDVGAHAVDTNWKKLIITRR